MFMWHCIIIAETTVCVATGAEMAGKLTGKLNIFVCVMRELTTMECATLITAILRHPTPNSMLLEKDDLNDSVSFMEITI